MKKLKVAVTGGIAAGKSTAMKVIKNLGFKTFSADECYKELLTDEKIVKSICTLIEIEPKIENGKAVFDRQLAADVVFSDRKKLEKLNKFTHKLVYEKIDDIYFSISEQKPVFFEVPLLFESKKEKDFDLVIVILRDKKKRIKALFERNGLTENEALKRIDNQFNYDNLDKTKHTLIYNGGDESSFENEVAKIVCKITKI